MLASQSQAGQIRLATESPEPLPIDEVLIDGRARREYKSERQKARQRRSTAERSATGDPSFPTPAQCGPGSRP